MGCKLESGTLATAKGSIRGGQQVARALLSPHSHLSVLQSCWRERKSGGNGVGKQWKFSADVDASSDGERRNGASGLEQQYKVPRRVALARSLHTRETTQSALLFLILIHSCQTSRQET